MSSLQTTYMGLPLRNPIMAGSSSLTSSPDRARAIEDAGAGALVLRSIFEEQIRSDVAEMYDALGEGTAHAEAYEYLRADLPMQLGPEKYLDNLEAIKAAVDIPVIASVNCVTPDQWVSFARKIESAGADGLEINIYDIPTDVMTSGADVEQRHLDTIGAVCEEVSLPTAAKLSPYYSSLLHFGVKAGRTGVRALVLFNRFLQPDIDVESMRLHSEINLSRAEDIRLPLRWIALIGDLVDCELCLTTGVHDAAGCIKGLLAGARAVQVCSALYARGTDVISDMVGGVEAWMARRSFESIDDFRGKLRESNLGDRQGLERAQYVKALTGVE